MATFCSNNMGRCQSRPIIAGQRYLLGNDLGKFLTGEFFTPCEHLVCLGVRDNGG